MNRFLDCLGVYFAIGHVAVVITGDVVQLFQVEWNDLTVQGDQLLLLHVIIGLVGHNGDFYKGAEA